MTGAPLFDPRRLQRALVEAGLDALVVTGAPNVLYLTRFRKPGGTLALAACAEPERPALALPAASVDFLVEDLVVGVEPRAYGSFHRFVSNGAPLSEGESLVWRVSEEARAGISASELVADLVRERGLEGAAIGLDADPATAPELAAALGGTRLEDARPLVRALRAVKGAEEVRRLREAARIAEQAIAATVRAARPGVAQRELAGVFSASVATAGAALRMDNVSVGPSTALGNANVPDDVVPERGLLRFDVGVIYEGYASDLSRCFTIGAAEEKAARYHRALLEGQRAALEEVRPGARAADVFARGVKAVRAGGIAHYERTNVGHGIGIAGDGYDAPLLAPGDETPLEEGMVLCIECPYYELGFAGLQVEDMVVVSGDGWKPLSELPRELVEVAG